MSQTRDRFIPIIAGIVGVLMLLVIAAVFFLQTDQQRRQQNSNQATAYQVEPPTMKWPTTFHRKIGAAVPLPKGMTQCTVTDTAVVIQNPPCDPAKPIFTTRGSDDWSTLETSAVFDQAFAQELREAGVEEATGSLQSMTGDETDIRWMELSTQYYGAVVSGLAEGGKQRKVAILIDRTQSALIEDVPTSVEDLWQRYLQEVRVSGPIEVPADAELLP